MWKRVVDCVIGEERGQVKEGCWLCNRKGKKECGRRLLTM